MKKIDTNLLRTLAVALFAALFVAGSTCSKKPPGNEDGTRPTTPTSPCVGDSCEKNDPNDPLGTAGQSLCEDPDPSGAGTGPSPGTGGAGPSPGTGGAGPSPGTGGTGP
jgi:hypothetical protein